MTIPAPEADDVSLDWYVSASKSMDPVLAAFVSSCAAEAGVLVDHHIGDAEVPESIRERAVLEVGADLYYRRAAKNGVSTFGGAGVEGVSVLRINRDPMTQAYAILRPWLGLGFA